MPAGYERRIVSRQSKVTKDSMMSFFRHRAILAAVLGFALPAPVVRAQVWRAMGPTGGDVRALAHDPQNPAVLYLGTTDGHIFGSRDRGDHWQLLGRAGESLQAVVTTILVDPRDSQELYASEWTRDAHGEGGGVFRSVDGGAHWTSLGLAGHAVRALAEAPSQPNELAAGALDGVFLSEGGGAHWQRISPAGDAELQNVDSIAINPRDPLVIYAGTFHLPWKTVDGGRHWQPIHSGMIDDSDVFSMVVDGRDPGRVFASACSGIYRSDNAGESWTKIQGIPFSARRTHVVVQDPSHPEIVYAGTTEGLWKTADGGANWNLMTPASWVVNALAVEPGSQRVVMGTEQLGVLVSDDGGTFFHVSNDGFYHRQVISVAMDARHPGNLLAVLANAPEAVMETRDSGQTWFPAGPGLRAQDVRKVYASPRGWLAALDHGGLELYDAAHRKWHPYGNISREINSRGFSPVVNDMAFRHSAWFAATSAGLFSSSDSGATWHFVRFAPSPLPVDSVLASGDGRVLWIVSSGGMLHSRDAGRSWRWRDLPVAAGRVLALHAGSGRTLLAAAENGLYISSNAGATWTLAAHGLPAAPPENIAATGHVWMASMRSGGLYLSEDDGQTWNRVATTLGEGFFPVVAAGTRGSLVMASTTEGLYMVEMDARSVAANLRSAPHR